MKVLVDSDIVIEVLRGRDAALLEKWSALAASSWPIFISPVTLAEVMAGARAGEEKTIEAFFAPLSCWEIEEQTAKLAAAYLRRYARSHGLKISDALIAASAMRCQAALWARNRKHYPMPELTIYE